MFDGLARARESTRRLLHEVTRVLDLYGQDDLTFEDESLAWFEAAVGERAMTTGTRSALAREAASARAARRGHRDPAVPAAASTRRALTMTVLMCLTRAEAVLREDLQGLERRLEDARDKLVQLLSVASERGPLPISGPAGEERALVLWNYLVDSDPRTRAMTTYLRLRFGTEDRCFLLQHLIDRLDEHAPAGVRELVGREGN